MQASYLNSALATPHLVPNFSEEAPDAKRAENRTDFFSSSVGASILKAWQD